VILDVVDTPSSRGRDGESERFESPRARAKRRVDPGSSRGEGVPARPADARRVTSAGLADFTERQAEAVAALDRALEARLGEFDRAFSTRRTDLEGRLSEAEGRFAEATETGVSDFKRAASGERRLLHEESAAELAELDRAARRHLQELEEAASTQMATLRQLIDRVHELERAAASRIYDLGEQDPAPAPAPAPGPRSEGWVSPGRSRPHTT
jgi:hypothetical protein